MKQKHRMACLGTILFTGAVLVLGTGCDDQSRGNNALISRKAVVSPDGMTIVFPPGSPGLQQIATSAVTKGTALISVLAPARVVARVLSTTGDTGKTVVFDSPDVTSLYSLYRQSIVNANRTALNLVRTREMYDNQGATAKELNEAENDAAVAKATLSEMQGKLIALGFNPRELDSRPAGTIWLISDVPETELHEVQRGEDVDVTFKGFPGKEYVGQAEAVGAVIDPVTRTVKVRVSMKNPGGELLPGMFASVDFGDPQNNVILIPLSAVVTVEGIDYAFVESDPGVFQRRPLTLTSSDSKQVIVAKGLKSGERVVTGGAILLKGLSFGY